MTTQQRIKRIESNGRLSKVLVHGTSVYLSGLTAKDKRGDVGAQTLDILAQIDDYLSQAGSDKTRLLRVNIWLHDIEDFDAMNAAWDTWVDKEFQPCRATVESKIAGGGVNKVEMMATAII